MNAALVRPEFLLLSFVLLFSPLAFGTVEPWSRAIAECAAFAGLAVALHRRTTGGRLHLHATPGTLPLLLFLGFILAQCLPLPPRLLLLLSPAAHARWDAALGSTGPLPWLPLSLDPQATLRELFRFSAGAAVYFLTVELLARRDRLAAVTVALPIFAAVLSFEALLQHLVAPRSLLFIRPAPSGQPFGPFVNRNHYANLMAMLTPVVLGLFLGSGPRSGTGTLRRRVVDLLARPESGVRLLLGFAALLSAASLVVSLSRGAMVAVVAALLLFGGSLVAQRIGKRRSAAVALFSYALAVFVGWFGWGKVAARFSSLRDNPDIVDTVRAGLWRDTLRMAADFPLLGSGVGSFERLYPAYRSVAGPFNVAHAHNDHLELIAGGGAVGFCLFSCFVGSALLAAARTGSRRLDASMLYLTFGAIAGCAAFLVHGGSDFSLAIGANAQYFFFMLGLAVSASHAQGHARDTRTLLAGVRLPAAVSLFAAALALLAVLGNSADLVARRAWLIAGGDLPRSGAPVPPAEVVSLVERAALLQPLDPAYPSALARIRQGQGDSGAATALTRRAVRLLPLDAASLTQLGSLLAADGRSGPARRSFEAAVAANPARAATRVRFGAWLLSQGDRAAGQAMLVEALALEPERAPAIFGMLVLAGYDDESIAALVPPRPRVLLKLARYATTTGALEIARTAYVRVLAIEPANREAAAGIRALAAAR